MPRGRPKAGFRRSHSVRPHIRITKNGSHWVGGHDRGFGWNKNSGNSGMTWDVALIFGVLFAIGIEILAWTAGPNAKPYRMMHLLSVPYILAGLIGFLQERAQVIKDEANRVAYEQRRREQQQFAERLAREKQELVLQQQQQAEEARTAAGRAELENKRLAQEQLIASQEAARMAKERAQAKEVEEARETREEKAFFDALDPHLPLSPTSQTVRHSTSLGQFRLWLNGELILDPGRLTPVKRVNETRKVWYFHWCRSFQFWPPAMMMKAKCIDIHGYCPEERRTKEMRSKWSLRSVPRERVTVEVTVTSVTLRGNELKFEPTESTHDWLAGAIRFEVEPGVAAGEAFIATLGEALLQAGYPTGTPPQTISSIDLAFS